MNSVAFYVIPWGPYYKIDICSDKFWEHFFIFAICAFCRYKFLPDLQQPRNEKKKGWCEGKISALREWVAPYMSGF